LLEEFAPLVSRMRKRTAAGNPRCQRLLILSFSVCCLLAGSWFPPAHRVPALAQVAVDPEAAAFSAQVAVGPEIFGAAVRGITAALVAAFLAAFAGPVVNRWLVSRSSLSGAVDVSTGVMVSSFRVAVVANMVKYPTFEIINTMVHITFPSERLRGIPSGFLFCTLTLPVTNFRFRKSMNWDITMSSLYEAYLPTLVRDIVYSSCRDVLGSVLTRSLESDTALSKACVFGLTVWCSCLASSPANEWRGYTLQPAISSVPFSTFFKPWNYLRSTGVRSTIVGISLMTGMLATPLVEALLLVLADKALVLVTVAVIVGVAAGQRRRG